MHISYSRTNQFKGFGVIEEIQSLLVCQTCLFSKQFDNPGVFALKEDWICLHTLQLYGFDKLKIAVDNLLGGDAELVVGFLPAQLVKSLLTGIDTLKIKINGVKDVVVSDTALNHVILFMRQSFAASHYVVEPFAIISKKHLAEGVGNIVRKFIDVQNGRVASTNKALTIVTSLLFQRSQIKPNAKVQVLARVENVGFRDDDTGCVEVSHAAFNTPFLFIKSMRSSTMYSFENVCNTS